MGSPSVERTIYEFLINDFITAWDAVAHEPHALGRGNFMFGRHVMALLEWAARLCSGDPSGDALAAFSASLIQVEPRYFTLLPGPCADTREFELPGRPGLAERREERREGLTSRRNAKDHTMPGCLTFAFTRLLIASRDHR